MSPQQIKYPLAKPTVKKPLYSTKIETTCGTVEAADPTVVRGLITLMDAQAVMGGAASHFGGPSALAEINSALYAKAYESDEWFSDYNLINDAGHCENGLYALKALYKFGGMEIKDLKGFRSVESKLTGHGESHVYPEGVYLSNGPLGSSVAQAQGLAMADKLSGSDRVTVLTLSDGGAMEGEAREALASIPGLYEKGKMNPFLMVISDNNTKLTGRIDEDSFSMQPSFKALEALGWDVKFNLNGHDLKGCYDVISESIKELKSGVSNKPIALHFKTVKGYGHKKSEDSPSGGHGFPLKTPEALPEFIDEIFNGESIPGALTEWTQAMIQEFKNKESSTSNVPKVKIQVGVAKALIELKKEGLPLVSVSADLQGSTGVAPFRKEFPEASFEVGVAESNMVSVAAGFSKQGYIPVVDTFSQFGVTKGALPIVMASLSQAPVMAFFSHTGFQDAADGASHQALSYYSMLCGIPNVDLVALSCSDEAYALVKESVKEFYKKRSEGKTPNSVVFFLGRETFPHNFGVENFSKYSVQSFGDAEYDSVLVTCGSMLTEALDAQGMLKERGHSTLVVNVPFMNHPPKELVSIIDKSKLKQVYTLEDHQLIGGVNGTWAHTLLTAGVKVEKFKSFGVDGVFGRSAYKASQLYSLHGMSGQKVAESILSK